MTKQETYQLLSLLQAFYPDSFRGLSDEAARLKVNLWHEFFADVPGEQVLKAAKAFISTDRKGFLPVPGQIKEQLVQLSTQEELTEQEAWSMVSRALRNSLYGFEEEYKRLPQELRRAVGSPSVLRSWAMLDQREVETVVASNFKRDYRAVRSHLRELAMLPCSVRPNAALQPGSEGNGLALL